MAVKDNLQMPTSIRENESEFVSGSWRKYSITELGNWVHLLVKRATHRMDAKKARKDLKDAQSYLDIMQAHIDAANRQVH